MNFISIICAAVLSLSSFQLPLFGKPSLDKYHEEILEMSVEDNLHSPEVPGKYVEVIKDRQMSMAKFLKGKGRGKKRKKFKDSGFLKCAQKNGH